MAKAVEKTVSQIEVAFAKLCIVYSSTIRLKFYYKLASLLRNRFSLMDALERMHYIESNGGKNPGEPMAIAIRVWSQLIQNGMSFSIALRGWAPANERLMLSVGDISKLEDALVNVIKVSEGSSRIIGPLIGAMAYPSFLLLLTFLIIMMVGMKMVPPLMEAAPNVQWQGTAESLVSLSNFVIHFWYTFPIAFVGAFVLFIYTLPLWQGTLRVAFDRFPPWSMYRIFVGVGFLLSLSALVRAGTPVSKALIILRTDSTPYLLERIDRMMIYINNGDNLGKALYNAGHGFPDREIINDLQIYAELDRFDEALERIANDWLEQSIKKINEQASILNTGAILLVAFTIAWVVYGTFEMQHQVTAQF